MLEVTGLDAFYGEYQALFGVDFVLDEGRVRTLLGANGAGKTTVLRALSGMIRTSGDIRFSGERVTSGTVGEKLPVGFGKSEFLLARGFLDQIVPRPQLKERLAFFLTAFRAASADVRWSL